MNEALVEEEGLKNFRGNVRIWRGRDFSALEGAPRVNEVSGTINRLIVMLSTFLLLYCLINFLPVANSSTQHT